MNPAFSTTREPLQRIACAARAQKQTILVTIAIALSIALIALAGACILQAIHDHAQATPSTIAQLAPTTISARLHYAECLSSVMSARGSIRNMDIPKCAAVDNATFGQTALRQ